MILVAGGTGRLGSRVANEACRQGHPVRVLSRGLTPPSSALDQRIEVVRADVRDPAGLRETMTGVDVVVSAIQGFQGPGGVTPASVDRDGNCNLVEAAETAGASFVLVSVFGAEPDSPMALSRMKFAAEQRLRSSTCAWTIVRADAYAETWVEVMEATAGSSRRPLVFGRGRNPVSFVSVGDVAALVRQAIADASLRGRVLEICGPEAISMSQLAAMVMERRGWDGDPRHVARLALRVIACTVGLAKPGLRRQARAALAMDDLPTRHDDSVRAEFPHLPRTEVSEVVATL